MYTRTRWFTLLALVLTTAPSLADEVSLDRSPTVSYYYSFRSTTEKYDLGALFHSQAKEGSVAVVDKYTCSARLWLALADGPACPKVDGWNTTSLFGASPARRQPGHPVRSFCRYESPRNPSGCAIAALQAEPKLHALVHRCNVVEEIATAEPARASKINLEPEGASAQLDELQSSEMARNFLYEVGAADLPHPDREEANVRLTVLDTVATGDGAPDSLPAGCTNHGFGLAHIAQKLTCDDKGCAAMLGTQLALPLLDSGGRAVDSRSNCGNSGTPGDVAVAIRAAVDRWQALPGDPKKRPHLILNLSLGWDPKVLHEQLGAIDPEDHLNAEELAVYDALAYAAEEGALTISAAGNALGGPTPEVGPTLPAGWYAHPPEVSLLPPSDDTVIWAVGGVARGGQPLVNSRKSSEPGLVTYGDHAVVKLPKGGYTRPLTGTSVSAAVASSAAAVVWHLRPELSGREVMELLSSSGSDLGRGAALYRTHGSADAAKEAPPGVRQLGFSAALRAALAPKAVLAKVEETRMGCHLVQVPAEKVPAVCAQRTYYTCDGVPPTCTADALPPKPVAGGVSTQPGANPCPSCTLGGGGGTTAALQIEIDSEWPYGCLTDPMLEVETPDGTKFGIPITVEKQLCPGDRLIVDDLDLPTSIAAARISFKYAEESYSVQSTIQIATSAATK